VGVVNENVENMTLMTSMNGELGADSQPSFASHWLCNVCCHHCGSFSLIAIVSHFHHGQ